MQVFVKVFITICQWDVLNLSFKFNQTFLYSNDLLESTNECRCGVSVLPLTSFISLDHLWSSSTRPHHGARMH